MKISVPTQSRFFLPLLTLALLLFVNVIFIPDFFSIEIKDGRLYGSIIDVLNRSAPCAIVAIGMALVVATGGIDLSVGAVVAISGAVCATLLNSDFNSLFIVIIAALGSGLLAGMLSGALVSVINIQPIVATLVLMVAGRGIAQLINGGQIITFQNDAFAWIGIGSAMGLPTAVVIAAFIFLLLQLLTRFTALGLFIEACGCNPIASRYAGLQVKLLTFLVYCISGVCAAIAGMIITADIQGADANNAGLWLELDAILAVVLGGASLAGGRFSLPLTIVGILIIQTLTTTVIMSGVDPKFNLLIKSVVIIFVLLLQSPIFNLQIRKLISPLRRTGVQS